MTNKERQKALDALRFLEEISWTLNSFKPNDVKFGIEVMQNVIINSDSIRNINSLIHNEKYNIENIDRIYKVQNESINLLIGVLPRLLQDKQLFETNLDLAEFGKNILKIRISRPEKRSRYEIVGMIVSEIIEFDENEISELLEIISAIGDPKNREEILFVKNENNQFRWNDAIKYLINKY